MELWSAGTANNHIISTIQANTTNKSYASGLIIDQTHLPIGGYTTWTNIANRWAFFPFIPQFSFKASSINIEVTSQATGNINLILFSSIGSFFPNRRIFYVSSFSTATTGTKSNSIVTLKTGGAINISTFQFEKGVLYWWGYHSSNASSVVRAVPVSNCISLGLNATTSTISYNHYSGIAAFNFLIDSMDSVITPALSSFALPSIRLITTT